MTGLAQAGSARIPQQSLQKARTNAAHQTNATRNPAKAQLTGATGAMQARGLGEYLPKQQKQTAMTAMTTTATAILTYQTAIAY